MLREEGTGQAGVGHRDATHEPRRDTNAVFARQPGRTERHSPEGSPRFSFPLPRSEYGASNLNLRLRRRRTPRLQTDDVMRLRAYRERRLAQPNSFRRLDL